MDNTEYIDDYFEGGRTEEEKQRFEKRVVEDPAFAEDVAFYITAKDSIKTSSEDESKKKFRELYDLQKSIPPIKETAPLKTMWRYIAAACITGVILLSWLFFAGNTSPRALADQYVKEHWQTVGVTMSSDKDSLQAGIALYNSGELTQAFMRFESILKYDPSSPRAKQYAGMAALRLTNYDKALQYFRLLAADTSLRSNYGKFYQAITYMKRNEAGDAAAAKKLLQQVINDDLEGKDEARDWLKNLD